MFAGAYDVYKQLGVELKTASVYNMDRTDPEGMKEILKRHNEFVYSMKFILAKVKMGKTPEEQMTILFGKEYTTSVIANENAITEAEAQEKALTARFNEIEELLRTNKISTGYYRSLYSSANRNRDQLYRRKRDAEKNLKKSKEYYTRKFNSTVSSLQNLSFLRTLEDWRRTLDQGDRSISSRLVPFTTANGSVIYRRANTTTTTQAQPKKELKKAGLGLSWSWEQPFSIKTTDTQYNRELSAEKIKTKLSNLYPPVYEGPTTMGNTALYEKQFGVYENEYKNLVKELAKVSPKDGKIKKGYALVNGFLSGLLAEAKDTLDPRTYIEIVKALPHITAALVKIAYATVKQGTDILDPIFTALGQEFGVLKDNFKEELAKLKTLIAKANTAENYNVAGKLLGRFTFGFVPIVGYIKKGGSASTLAKKLSTTVTKTVDEYNGLMRKIMQLPSFDIKPQFRHTAYSLKFGVNPKLKGKIIDETKYYNLPDNSDVLFDTPQIKTMFGLNKIRYGIDELDILIKAQKKHNGASEIMYVMKEDGELVLSIRSLNESYLPHPVLSKGQPVKVAGTIDIDKNGVLIVDNYSGHFQPSELVHAGVPDELKVVVEKLEVYGYTAERVSLIY